jgi:hypothetical protein
MRFFQSPAMTRRAFETVREGSLISSDIQYRPRRNALTQHPFKRPLCMDDTELLPHNPDREVKVALNQQSIDHEQALEEQLVKSMEQMSLPVKKDDIQTISREGKKLLWLSLQKMNREPEVSL